MPHQVVVYQMKCPRAYVGFTGIHQCEPSVTSEWHQATIQNLSIFSSSDVGTYSRFRRMAFENRKYARNFGVWTSLVQCAVRSMWLTQRLGLRPWVLWSALWNSHWIKIGRCGWDRFCACSQNDCLVIRGSSSQIRAGVGPSLTRVKIQKL